MKCAMVSNITCFCKVLLLCINVYLGSVTIARYYYTLIGLCHCFHSEKVLVIGKYGVTPIPLIINVLRKIVLVWRGGPTFFHNCDNVLRFLFNFVYMFTFSSFHTTIILYNVNTSLLG